MDSVLEWDQLLTSPTAAFNWFLNEHTHESPHFLCFGCDPYLPHLATYLQPKLRYLGSDKGMICIVNLRQAYMLVALNTKKAPSKQNKDKNDYIPHHKIEDLAMIKNFNKNELEHKVYTLFQNNQPNRS